MGRFKVLAPAGSGKQPFTFLRGPSGLRLGAVVYNASRDGLGIVRKPMAMHQANPQGGRLAALDPIWGRVRSEAEDIVHREPELATFIFSTVLHHDRLEASV